jgi:hypothetical protein
MHHGFRGVSIVTDVHDHEACIGSVNDVKLQCTLDTAIAAEHHADYAAGLLLVVRGVRLALGFSSDDPIHLHVPVTPVGSSSTAQLLAVLAAACSAAHALAKVPLQSREREGARASLRREVSLTAALLSLAPGLPEPAANIVRLTAKSIVRGRGAKIASDVAAAMPLLDWVSAILERDVDDHRGPPLLVDVAIAMLVVDRLGRDSPDQAASDTPEHVVRAVAGWHTTKCGSRSDVADDAAVHRLVAEDFVARHRVIIGGLGDRVEPPHRTPRRRIVTTPRLHNVANGLNRTDSGDYDASFAREVDGAELVRQLLDGHGWNPGDLLTLEEVHSVLAAAKECLELAAVQSSRALADAMHERHRRQHDLAQQYDELRSVEDTAFLVARDQGASSTRTNESAMVSNALDRLEAVLESSSAATPRLLRRGSTPTPVLTPRLAKARSGVKGRAGLTITAARHEDVEPCEPFSPA